MSSESENIIPSYYSGIKDAAAIAAKVKRNSLLLREPTGNWRIVLPTNRKTLYDDVRSLNLKDEDGIIYINDTYGNIQRNKVLLKNKDVKYYSKILSHYSSTENYISGNIPGLSNKIKKFIIKVIPKETAGQHEEPEEVKVPDRSGTYERPPGEFFCYFKSFIPVGLVIEQEVGIECYEKFNLHISFRNKTALDTSEPLFRKAKQDFEKAAEHINNGRALELKLKLRQKVLDRIKYRLFATSIEDLFSLKNPLNKSILGDLSNYELEEVKYL